MGRLLLVSAAGIACLLNQSGPTAVKSLLGGAVPKPSSAQVTVTKTAAGVAVAIAPGLDNYPGFALTPAQPWDLAKFGHIEAHIRNTGANPLFIALRVDNAGNWQDNPNNTESTTIEPGAVGTVTTIFGYSYGHKPAFKLDPSRVVNLLLFTGKTDVAESFRVDSILAAGPPSERPPVAPDDSRTKPVHGLLFDATQSWPDVDHGDPSRLKPHIGRWDLRDADAVRVTIRNTGTAPVTPAARIESNGGNTPWVSAQVATAPGRDATITIPFAHLIDLTNAASNAGITSDAVSAIALSTPSGGPLAITSVAAISAIDSPPAWLGQRPPVPGNWTKTLDDEFNGTSLDPTVWKATGENYYDKVTHWSKQNLVVGGGVAKLHFEKRPGFQNDDPKRNSTPYAAGYLDTFGLWAQRYGYFEARMKLPHAPGLWPAFWMMPDRGSKLGPEQWKRQSTADGGMEFDIMEHLTRWGGHRYNVAMHYDGYEKDHKSLGSDKIYVSPDKDGFITCGLLWTPGEAVYYCNGKELLRWKSPRVANVPAILMFTLPSGGWDNDPLDDTKLPADFIIDYVRVWQRQDLAQPGDGKRKDP